MLLLLQAAMGVSSAVVVAVDAACQLGYLRDASPIVRVRDVSPRVRVRDASPRARARDASPTTHIRDVSDA